jgi:hypothetical protein
LTWTLSALIWSTRKYQQLDPGWLGAAAAWLEHLILGKHAFPAGTPSVTNIPDDLAIAIAGDFGTGNWGTAADPAEEIANLVKLWPKGSGPDTSYTMNANPEM